MKRLILDCSDEMAQLLQRLSASGEINIRGEADIPKPSADGKTIRDYYGYIPEKDRASWREYAATLGTKE